jgi:glycosyltransferase involved in cell wall biosynthesis
LKNREDDGIYYLGRYNKHQLYEEMSKHKVWFYPAIYPETFCITSLETALNGNLPVLPFRHGMATTFEPYNGFFMKNRFKEIWSIDGNIVENNDAAINEAVNMIAEYMNNFDKYKNLQESLYNYVMNNYSWKKIVDKWEAMFKTFK